VVLAAVANSCDGYALNYALIPPVDFSAFVRNSLVAQKTFFAFLLATRPSDASRPPPATRPAPWKLDVLGDANKDAGRHVRQLIADFAGVPCGKAWTTTRAAAKSVPIF